MKIFNKQYISAINTFSYKSNKIKIIISTIFHLIYQLFIKKCNINIIDGLLKFRNTHF